MSRTGGGDTGGRVTGGGGSGARAAGGDGVGGASAWRVAVVVVGAGPVVTGAPVVVVDSAVVVVVDDVVDGGATGRSATATWMASWRGAIPAGEAPAQVDAPTSTAASSGLATNPRASKAGMGVSTSHPGAGGKDPGVSFDAPATAAAT